MRDVSEVRADMPILERFTYLDAAATTPTPRPVWEAMIGYFRDLAINTGRAAYSLAAETETAFENARKEVAGFLGCQPKELLWMRNSTEALNTIANGTKFREKDSVIISSIEHHSNLIPWQRIARKTGISLQIVKVEEEGVIEADKIASAIDKDTRIVSLAHVSNLFGTIQPINEIADVVHDAGALLAVDGAQSVGHMNVDLSKLKCDFFAFSGHKGMFGPQGTGGLVIREKNLYDIEPLSIGGGTVESVTRDSYKLREPPYRFDAGTPNIPGAIGLAAACQYVKDIGIFTIEKKERELTERFMDGISEAPSVEILGTQDMDYKSGVVSFDVGEIPSHEVAVMLDERWNILMRSGDHCAQPALRSVGRENQGAVRASFAYYNTDDEIDRAIEAIEKIAKAFA